METLSQGRKNSEGQKGELGKNIPRSMIGDPAEGLVNGNLTKL